MERNPKPKIKLENEIEEKLKKTKQMFYTFVRSLVF
jgi:hypothetical protein